MSAILMFLKYMSVVLYTIFIEKISPALDQEKQKTYLFCIKKGVKITHGYSNAVSSTIWA
jgi:hypothetical protein